MRPIQMVRVFFFVFRSRWWWPMIERRALMVLFLRETRVVLRLSFFPSILSLSLLFIFTLGRPPLPLLI